MPKITLVPAAQQGQEGSSTARRRTTSTRRPATNPGASVSEPPAQPVGAHAAESSLARTRRARRMYRTLRARYPDAHCELDFASPFQLVVATVLSAQTTDVTVNQVTPALFARYPTPAALAGADRCDVEAIIGPTGFFRAKTESLLRLGAALVERYDGQVPARMEDLVTLPGVGRKTANVVLGNAFNVPGITVDTHVGRLAQRFGWTEHDDPLRVEADIAALIPRRDWTMLSHVVIFHGRRTCHARKPACGACVVARDCSSYGIGETDPNLAARLVKAPPAGSEPPAASAPAAAGTGDPASGVSP